MCTVLFRWLREPHALGAPCVELPEAKMLSEKAEPCGDPTNAGKRRRETTQNNGEAREPEDHRRQWKVGSQFRSIPTSHPT